jgi:hypothetical protein
MPAETTVLSGQARFIKPSAIGLRQMLPMQMTRMLLIT